MSRRYPVVLLLSLMTSASLAPAPAFAGEPGRKPLNVSPDAGWYVSGKGGPSWTPLRNVEATGSTALPQETESSNVGGAFGMAGGYEWMYRYRIPLRTEIEFMNRTESTYNASPTLLTPGSGALSSTVQNVTAMARGYWHFPVNSDKWWPFVSGGVGLSHNSVKSLYTPPGGTPVKSNSGTDDLAWSVGTGATFKLGPQVMNDIEIRYVDLGKVQWDLPAGQGLETKGVGGYSATEVIFSLRYMF